MLPIIAYLFSTVWVDCFTKFPLNNENYEYIKRK